ncbi:hypothetical protein BGZ76_010649 [Entomortierella beljakovae]|nr:hypothetical protein BGZ76_010649 [Entomortierella beljakovae]
MSQHRYNFCMCNPPFYEDEQEIQDNLESKEETPSAICNGTPNEMITQGGEVQFVRQMIDESGIRVCWVKKAQWKKLLATSETTRTTRWAIAWSFNTEHAPQASTQRVSKKLIKLAPTARVQSFTTDMSKEHAIRGLREIMDQLMINQVPSIITSDDHAEQDVIHGRAVKNTWSRAARRAMARKTSGSDALMDNEFLQDNNSPTIMGFDLCLLPEAVDQELEVKTDKATATNPPSSGVRVQFTWTIGHDRDIFESFFLHVRNRFMSQSLS